MDKKILVAFFSVSGETAKLAGTIASVTGGDLFEIKPEKKYTPADLDWNNKASRSSIEMNDKGNRPAIAGRVEGMERYDTVFVGFPIWWYEAPRIIQTFLESYDFDGKTVIPFATSGGSGMGKTDSILKESCALGTKWCEGRRMASTAGRDAVQNWVETLKL